MRIALVTLILLGLTLAIPAAATTTPDFVLASFTLGDRSVFVNAWTDENGDSHGRVRITGPNFTIRSHACVGISGKDAEIVYGAPTDRKREDPYLAHLLLRDNRGTNQPDTAYFVNPPPWEFGPVPSQCPFNSSGGSPITSGDISIHDG